LAATSIETAGDTELYVMADLRGDLVVRRRLSPITGLKAFSA
jgi:hypothetical protein